MRRSAHRGGDRRQPRGRVNDMDAKTMADISSPAARPSVPPLRIPRPVSSQPPSQLSLTSSSPVESQFACTHLVGLLVFQMGENGRRLGLGRVHVTVWSGVAEVSKEGEGSGDERQRCERRLLRGAEGPDHRHCGRRACEDTSTGRLQAWRVQTHVTCRNANLGEHDG